MEISHLCRSATFIFLPALFAVAAFSWANFIDVDKKVSVILDILSALSSSIAGAFLYDTYKNITGDTLLIKKGASAIRHLSLTRVKTNNISNRAKIGALPDEIINLLGLLEKDIANATQEWNDILPGVNKIEEIYALLAEKENELEFEKNERERLDKQLSQEKQLNDSEKTELKKAVQEKDKKVDELYKEVALLKATTARPILTTMSSSSAQALQVGLLNSSAFVDFSTPQHLGLLSPMLGICKKCKRSYKRKSVSDSGLCKDCEG